ncbi:MAG: 6-phosphogluconolactonase [Dorea sp.]
MKIYKAKDYQDMSRKAANIISAQVITKPDCVLGLATGSTPEGMYAQLVEWYKKGDLDFSDVKSVNLDEYRGMTRDNDQSYYYFMHKHLFDHVNIDRRIHTCQMVLQRIHRKNASAMRIRLRVWVEWISSFLVWDTMVISDSMSRVMNLPR